MQCDFEASYIGITYTVFLILSGWIRRCTSSWVSGLGTIRAPQECLGSTLCWPGSHFWLIQKATMIPVWASQDGNVRGLGSQNLSRSAPKATASTTTSSSWKEPRADLILHRLAAALRRNPSSEWAQLLERFEWSALLLPWLWSAADDASQGLFVRSLIEIVEFSTSEETAIVLANAHARTAAAMRKKGVRTPATLAAYISSSLASLRAHMAVSSAGEEDWPWIQTSVENATAGSYVPTQVQEYLLHTLADDEVCANDLFGLFRQVTRCLAARYNPRSPADVHGRTPTTFICGPDSNFNDSEQARESHERRSRMPATLGGHSSNPGTENCLYWALSQGLRGNPNPDRMRRLVAMQIMQHQSRYRKCWNGSQWSSFSAYVAHLANQGASGDATEIQAAADLFQLFVVVLGPNGRRAHFWPSEPSGWSQPLAIALWLDKNHYELIEHLSYSFWS